MSSLIVTIIAIALIAAAALAASYYGSSSWSRGQEQAKATTLLNQKEQIKTAAAMYRATQGDMAPSVAELADPAVNLLQEEPRFEEAPWESAGDKVFVRFPSVTEEEDAESVCGKAWANETGNDEDDYDMKECDKVAIDDVCCYSD
jgi:hypothetical protein